MDECPKDLKYAPTHEWVKTIDGSTLRVGITDHAVELLHGVVFVSLPAVGQQVTAGEQVGEVESTKAVSDVYSPVSGVVSAINDSAGDDPDLVNNDPYEAGWLFDIDVTDMGQLDTLLDAQAYTELTN
jgi:glycine cleavage system H protein